MSLCYDFQKWTILTLGLVAISLTVGLAIQYTHGYMDPEPYITDPDLYQHAKQHNELDDMLRYI
jgi:hypothetical protein